MSVATSCFKADGQKVSSPTKSSISFNNFFPNIWSGLAEKLPATDTDPLSYYSRCTHNEHFDFLEVSSKITDEAIKNSSSKKAVGYDGVNYRQPTDTFTHFNSHDQHHNRDIKNPWQRIDSPSSPLHKKGDKLDRKNDRLISIPTAYSKITEEVLAIKLRFYLENTSTLSDCQFGFQENRNTTSAISRLTEQRYKNFDNGA